MKSVFQKALQIYTFFFFLQYEYIFFWITRKNAPHTYCNKLILNSLTSIKLYKYSLHPASSRLTNGKPLASGSG